MQGLGDISFELCEIYLLITWDAAENIGQLMRQETETDGKVARMIYCD